MYGIIRAQGELKEKFEPIETYRAFGYQLKHVAGDIGVRVEASQWISGKLEVWVAHVRVLLVILESVQVLVPLAADRALVGFLLLHANGTGIGCTSDGVNYRKRTIRILLQFLVIVTVLCEKSSVLANAQNNKRNTHMGYLPVCDISGHSGSCTLSRSQ